MANYACPLGVAGQVEVVLHVEPAGPGQQVDDRLDAVRFAVVGRAEQKHAALPRHAVLFARGAGGEELPEVALDPLLQVPLQDQVVEAGGADGGEQLGALLPAAAAEDEHLAADLVAPLADVVQELLGDGTLVDDDPIAAVLVISLAPRRRDDLQPATIPFDFGPAVFELDVEAEAWAVPIDIELGVDAVFEADTAMAVVGELLQVEVVTSRFDNRLAGEERGRGGQGRTWGV